MFRYAKDHHQVFEPRHVPRKIKLDTFMQSLRGVKKVIYLKRRHFFAEQLHKCFQSCYISQLYNCSTKKRPHLKYLTFVRHVYCS